MPLTDIRRALARWIAGPAGASRKRGRALAGKMLPARHQSVDQRLLLFLGKLAAGKKDWLGKVRLVNLDTVKQRVGNAWPKLSEKVELLTAKIIRDKLSLRDSYLRMGEAEFLIFFADASAEEAKIRCLAIVETIHEKLFGRSETAGEGTERVAECHVALEPNMCAARSVTDHQTDRRSAKESLAALFGTNAEVIDGAEIAAVIQTVLDIIIQSASESCDLAELGPLEARLKNLARDLTTLRPRIDIQERHDPKYSGVVRSLREAEQDTTDLICTLRADPGHSHDKVMEALSKLRSGRADRMAKAASKQTPSFRRRDAKETRQEEFEYVPIYRSVSKGEQIYKGIYQIKFRDHPNCDRDARRPAPQRSTEHHYHEVAARERSLLREAIRRCDDGTIGADFVLVVPVHAGTLNRPYLQRRYATILRGIEPASKRRLILDIVGYRESDDTIGMRRAIEELRLHSHAIFISQPYSDVVDTKAVVEACKRLGAHAIGQDYSYCGEADARIVSAISQFIHLGQENNVPTYINGIMTTTVLAKALAGGISYICAPRLIPPETTPSNFERTTLKDLFWAVT